MRLREQGRGGPDQSAGAIRERRFAFSVLDGAEVRRSIEENGSYRLPKGTKVVLEVHKRWKNGTKGIYLIPSEVTEGDGLEVSMGSSLMDDKTEEKIDSAISRIGRRAKAVVFSPSSAEIRQEQARITESLREAQFDHIILSAISTQLRLTLREKLAKRKRRAKMKELYDQEGSVNRDTAKAILARRPEFPGSDGERHGLKLEDVYDLRIIAATS